MSNLLKVDLLRFLRSKQFIIASIVSVVVAICIPLLYFGIENIIKFLVGTSVEEDADPIIDQFHFFAKDFAFIGGGSVYTIGKIGTGIGISFIVNSILFSVAIGKEFSYGIVRNKIIAGHSRINIYLSLFISLYIFLFGIAFVSSLAGFITGIIVFPYDADGWFFNNFVNIISQDFGNFMLCELYSALGYLFLTAVLCFFTVALDKTALAIILPIILSVLSLFVCALLEGLTPVVAEYNVFLKDLIIWFNTNNPFYSFVYFNLYGFKLYQLVAFIINPICWASLITFFGILIFLKKDLK